MLIIEKYLNREEYYSFHEHKTKNTKYFCNARAIESLTKYSLKKIQNIYLCKKIHNGGINCNISGNKLEINIYINMQKEINIHQKTIEIQERVLQKIKDVLDIRVHMINVILEGFKK